MELVSFAISFFSCILGRICGMGGGVIIKPLLDALNICGSSAISFLSGCTVVGMSFWSILREWRFPDSRPDLHISVPLGIGAALGGALGKRVFNYLIFLLKSEAIAGGLQALMLLIATALTLSYTLLKKPYIVKPVGNKAISAAIGAALGMLGSFCGIGGGPFNVAMLCLFFKIPIKKAVINSLFIILVSQITGLAVQVFCMGDSGMPLYLIIGMIICAVWGSECGRLISRKLKEEQVNACFKGAMILVMAVSVFNIRVLFR